MRTLIVLLIATTICTGHPLNLRELIDFLTSQDVLESKKHWVTPADKRHGYTPEAKRMIQELLESKKHWVTPEYKRHGFTPEAKRMETTPQVTIPDETTPIVQTTIAVSVGDYYGYEEAFMFPGSHYLSNMIREHCESGHGLKISVNDIVDQFEIPDCDFMEVGEVFGLLGRIQDTDGIAVLATRLMIKPMLLSRMKCPATILEMGLTKLLLAKKHHFVSDDDKALYTFLKKMAPVVEPALEPFAHDIAIRGALEIHERLFRDTMDFLWKYGLKDLAFSSHQIYHELQNYFNQVQNVMGESEQLQTGLKDAFSRIKCPSTCDVVDGHVREIQRFKDVFSKTETDHICLEVIDFLTKYIGMAVPDYQPKFDKKALDTVCGAIQVVIVKSVEEYSKYEHFLYSTEITDFKSMAENVLQQNEWNVLEEAIDRLNLKDQASASC